MEMWAEMTRPVRGREEDAPTASKAVLRVLGHQARLGLPDLVRMPGGNYLYREAYSSSVPVKLSDAGFP